MAKKRSPEDLSADELRRLLVEKRRASRQDRLERYRETGRIVSISPEYDSPPLEDLRDDQFEDAKLNEKPGARKFFDRFLLVMEVLAVVGLIFILFNGLNIIRELNQEAALALLQPTLTPTPLFKAVVLPSGHTPPDSPGGAKFNIDEIPSHLQPIVQSLASVPIPTPGPQQAIRIQIPSIGVDAPVVQGDGEEQLKKGVGQHIWGANPGEDGNLILSAHNDIYGEIFRYLDDLKAGDEIVVYSIHQAFTYIVSRTDVVDPLDIEVLESSQKPLVTLISCYPYMVDTQRYIVQGYLKGGS